MVLVFDESGDEYQFGFKAKYSTGLCTSVMKGTRDYYTERGSHVFVLLLISLRLLTDSKLLEIIP